MKVAMDAAKLRARGQDIVDFGPGEPDFPPANENALPCAPSAITRYAGGEPWS
jgi:hypothetical protein